MLFAVAAAVTAQREVFARDRQLERGETEIARLRGEVTLRDRKLEAEEVLLRRLRDLARLPR